LNGGHVTADVSREAIGALEAQRVVEGLQRDEMTAEHAWLAFVGLAACNGWKSAACMGFVRELAKRATA